MVRPDVEMVALTDPGRLRRHNEDAVFVNPTKGVAILADGLGGYKAGEVASRMAVMLLADKLDKLGCNEKNLETLEPELYEQVLTVNRAIYQASLRNSRYMGMGTTLVFGLFSGDSLLVGHVGDSRCYRFREGRLKCLTRDHSFLREQIDQGFLTEFEAQNSNNKGLLTRALGVDSGVSSEFHNYSLWEGDVYLFCSDGLSDMVEEEDMAQILRSPEEDLFSLGNLLIEQANNNGGDDNISVILVKVSGSDSQVEHVAKKASKN